LDVTIGNIVDGACGTRVGLDSWPILGSDNLTVAENDTVDCVVALEADRANTETMSAVDVGVVPNDVLNRGGGG
jgi:hypothetical protein